MIGLAFAYLKKATKESYLANLRMYLTLFRYVAMLNSDAYISDEASKCSLLS